MNARGERLALAAARRAGRMRPHHRSAALAAALAVAAGAALYVAARVGLHVFNVVLVAVSPLLVGSVVAFAFFCAREHGEREGRAIARLHAEQARRQAYEARLRRNGALR